MPVDGAVYINRLTLQYIVPDLLVPGSGQVCKPEFSALEMASKYVGGEYLKYPIRSPLAL